MADLAVSNIYFLDIALLVFLFAASVAILRSPNLLNSIIYLGVLSLLAALLFATQQAPDVAITEAAIGAAISTLFLLIAIRKIGNDETTPRQKPYLAAGLLIALTLTMFSVVGDMPIYGSSTAPANGSAAREYLASSYEQTHIPNVVTSVLASYRGFDTLGETYVIFAALLCVLLILPSSQRGENA